MAVVLSPAPTTPAAMAKARDYLGPLIGLDPTDDADRLDALIAVAAAHVERYAPTAPDAVKSESVTRFCGYLAQSDYGAVVNEQVGPQQVTYVANHGPAFRNCGAKALLSPWKKRRAGSIG